LYDDATTDERRGNGWDKQMKRLSAVLVAIGSLLTAGCSTAPFPGVPEQGQGTGGIVRMGANAAVHHVYPTLESMVLEYSEDIVLPDEEPGEFYSFTDNEGGQSTREITGVHTNTEARIRDDGTSVPGKFVIIELDRIENPDPQNPAAWQPASTAGRAVLFTGSRNAFRTDYSGLAITQNFDATGGTGQIVQKAGPLPDLAWENIEWPEFSGFSIDNVFSGKQGDIHYSYYLPPDYDPSRNYPLMVALPGYGGLLHSLDEDTRGVNVFSDRNALAWTQADEDVIVLAPQLTGWDTQSAAQTVELTEHFLERYAVDRDRVYALGFSGGGETMSHVMNTRADLFAAYVHVSSQWNGGYDDVVENRVPVYVFMGENDEYYGAQKARDVRNGLTLRYATAGLSDEEINRLVVLDLRDDNFFNRYGITYYHGGGAVAGEQQTIVRWVLDQRKQ
jgi:predicted peptidase